MKREAMFRQMQQVLLRRRASLFAALSGELHEFHTNALIDVGDTADAALDGDYGEVNSQLAQTESRELALVEHALERLAAGRYGFCEMCGEPIPFSRLQALPYAATCVRCQRHEDHVESPERLAEHWAQVREELDAEEETRPVALINIRS